MIRFINIYSIKVCATDANSVSQLHKAAMKGHLPTLEFLVANGAIVNAVDHHGNTHHKVMTNY